MSCSRLYSVFFVGIVLVTSCMVKRNFDNQQNKSGICDKYVYSNNKENQPFFSIQLDSNGFFREENYWGTIAGTWDVSQERGKRGLLHITLTPKVIESTKRYMHYDGVDTSCAFRTGMYYYTCQNSAKQNHVELRDRDGCVVNISYALMFDSVDNEILRYNPQSCDYHGGVPYVEIPENTKKIRIAGDDIHTTAVSCDNYESDSGSVCCVLMPNNNDKFRLWIFDGSSSIFFLPHSCKIPRRYALVSRKKMIHSYGAKELLKTNNQLDVK